MDGRIEERMVGRKKVNEQIRHARAGKRFLTVLIDAASDFLRLIYKTLPANSMKSAHPSESNGKQ